MKNDISKTRETNIELLRIFAMMCIIGCHLAGHGVMHLLSSGEAYKLWFEGSGINKLTACMMMPGAQIGTALFFMISGYFLINLRLKSVVRLWSSVVFYGIISIIIMISVIIFGGEFTDLSLSGTLSYCLKMIVIPLTGGSYWYITTYFFLMMLSPLINKWIKDISKKQYIIVLILIYVFWYAIGTFMGSDFYNLQKAIFYYLFGFFINKYVDYSKINRVLRYKVILLVGALCSWICGGIIYYWSATFSIAGKSQMFIRILDTFHASIVTPICAVTIFILFCSIDLKYNKIINIMGGAILGVFLLHDSGVSRSVIWSTIFRIDEMYLRSGFIVASVLVIIAILIIGVVIEVFRKRLFSRLETNIVNRINIIWED